MVSAITPPYIWREDTAPLGGSLGNGNHQHEVGTGAPSRFADRSPVPARDPRRPGHRPRRQLPLERFAARPPAAAAAAARGAPAADLVRAALAATSGVRDVAVCLNRASRAARRGADAEAPTPLGLEILRRRRAARTRGVRARRGPARRRRHVRGRGGHRASRRSRWPTCCEAHRASGALATVVVQQETPGGGEPVPLASGAAVRVRAARARAGRPEGLPGHQGEPDPAALPRRRTRGRAPRDRAGARVLEHGTYLDTNH